jgi:formylmethanofuran dehydrogenase subunit E
MIALKALGELDDSEYQPELLIEENLKLRIQVEDLESKIIKYSIDKVFPTEAQAHPLMHCKDCGEYWGYHHEEYCKGKLLDIADKHSKMYP